MSSRRSRRASRPAALLRHRHQLHNVPVRAAEIDAPTAIPVVDRAILEAAGATVSLADDGLDGLDVLRAGHFDVVLMAVHK